MRSRRFTSATDVFLHLVSLVPYPIGKNSDAAGTVANQMRWKDTRSFDGGVRASLSVTKEAVLSEEGAAEQIASVAPGEKPRG
jgi:phage host-nuclease inhibitor protein Gam